MKQSKLIVLLSASLLAACAGPGKSSFSNADIPVSGYLGDYSMLRDVPGNYQGYALRWVSPSLHNTKYTKIIVDPVIFYPEPNLDSQVRQDNLDKISAYITEQLKKEIGKSFELTNTPGPDTANLKFAITGVSTNLEGLKAYEVVPVALVFAGASTALGYRDKVVTISVEGMLSDSMTNEVMVKGLRQGVAQNLKDDKEHLKVEHVKNLVDEWVMFLGELSVQIR